MHTYCSSLTFYIKNARECLTMISKHEKAYDAQGAKPRELFTAFECFDIMHGQTRTQVFDMTSPTDYSSA